MKRVLFGLGLVVLAMGVAPTRAMADDFIMARLLDGLAVSHLAALPTLGHPPTSPEVTTPVGIVPIADMTTPLSSSAATRVAFVHGVSFRAMATPGVPAATQQYQRTLPASGWSPKPPILDSSAIEIGGKVHLDQFPAVANNFQFIRHVLDKRTTATVPMAGIEMTVEHRIPSWHPGSAMNFVAAIPLPASFAPSFTLGLPT